MSKQETITFRKTSPLMSFGEQTILSAQIENNPGIEVLAIVTDEDADLVHQYLECAHPNIAHSITPLSRDNAHNNIDGDLLEGFDLSSEDDFIAALEHHYGRLPEFDFSKPDEAIYFVNGRVIKYFKDPIVVQNRIERAKLLAGLVPEIDYKGRNFYSYKFVEGKTIYDSLVPGMRTDFLEWCDSKLWNPTEILLNGQQKADFEKNCLDFYKNKTLKRVGLYWSNCGHDDRPSVVNGVETPTLSELLSKVDWNLLSNGTPSRFHGDLHFDNSIYSYKTGEFLLLDWRHEFAGMTQYADMYYDLAKLNGGLITPYSAIKKNRFTYKQHNDEVTLEIEMPEYLDLAREEFDAFVLQHNLDRERISLITGLIFINMSPLHTTPFDLYLHQLGKLMLTKHFEMYK